MKYKTKKHIVSFLIIIIEQTICQNSIIITTNYWLFESMTTITKAKREEILILYQDKNNFESLTFKKPNILEYYVINDGFEHTGLAKWSLNDKNLTIISNKDTIESIAKIENNILSIITTNIEPGTNYDFTTIIKYKNHINNSE